MCQGDKWWLCDRFYISAQAKEGTKFPVKWTAPEAALFNQFSVKSDVWSFGVLLMEIATDGQTPYPGMKNIEVLQEIKKGFRQPKPDDCPDIFYEVWTV
jgi:serine/threonine protein kinase